MRSLSINLVTVFIVTGVMFREVAEAMSADLCSWTCSDRCPRCQSVYEDNFQKKKFATISFEECQKDGLVSWIACQPGKVNCEMTLCNEGSAEGFLKSENQNSNIPLCPSARSATFAAPLDANSITIQYRDPAIHGDVDCDKEICLGSGWTSCPGAYSGVCSQEVSLVDCPITLNSPTSVPSGKVTNSPGWAPWTPSPPSISPFRRAEILSKIDSQFTKASQAVNILAAEAEAKLLPAGGKWTQLSDAEQNSLMCSPPACGTNFPGFFCTAPPSGGSFQDFCGGEPDCGVDRKSGLLLSKEFSVVRLPPGTDFSSASSETFIKRTSQLDTTFKANSESLGATQTQIVSNLRGISRVFPGHPQDRKEGQCGSYDPVLRPWYVNTLTGPKDVVIVYDKSSSMEERTSAGSTKDAFGNQLTRLEAVKRAIDKLLTTFTNEDHVGIVEFSSVASRRTGKTLQRMNPTKIAEFQEIVHQASPGGRTHMAKAFREAFRVLQWSAQTPYSSNCTKIVLFLTDGVSTEPSQMVKDAVEAGQNALDDAGSKRAHIFSYSLGSEADDLLPKSLACENQGVWARINPGEDPLLAMKHYFEFLEVTATDARVHWTSPFQDPVSQQWMVSASRTLVDRASTPNKVIGVASVQIALLADLGFNHGGWETEILLEEIGSRRSCPGTSVTDCSLQFIRKHYAYTCPAPAPAYDACWAISPQEIEPAGRSINSALCQALNTETRVPTGSLLKTSDISCCSLSSDANTAKSCVPNPPPPPPLLATSTEKETLEQEVLSSIAKVKCSSDQDCLNELSCAVARCSSTGYCLVTGVRSNSHVCRPAAGRCDIQDTCDGYHYSCPELDLVRPKDYECRQSAGACDFAESCDGESKSCPKDQFRPKAVACRADVGPCDLIEYCTGDSADCPRDQVKARGSICRRTAGECDVAEYCSGYQASCPDDTYLPKTSLCRPAKTACDEPEYCAGDTWLCPPDLFKPAGDICRPSMGGCDKPEVCDAGGSCPNDDSVYEADHECRPAAGPCDIPEVCDGSSSLCPPDAVLPRNLVTPCREKLDSCDVADFCDGVRGECINERHDSGFVYKCEGNATCRVCAMPESEAATLYGCENFIHLEYPLCKEQCIPTQCDYIGTKENPTKTSADPWLLNGVASSGESTTNPSTVFNSGINLPKVNEFDFHLFLDCVEKRQCSNETECLHHRETEGTYLAHFGYNNPYAFDIEIQTSPSENQNRLLPLSRYKQDAAQHRKLPTKFQPGRHYSAFTVTFGSSTSQWVRWQVTPPFGESLQAAAVPADFLDHNPSCVLPKSDTFVPVPVPSTPSVPGGDVATSSPSPSSVGGGVSNNKLPIAQILPRRCNRATAGGWSNLVPFPIAAPFGEQYCPAWPPQCEKDSDCETVAYPRQSCQGAVCQENRCKLVVKEAGVLCRPANGTCDEAEFCDGTSPTCPEKDVWKPFNVTCRPAVPGGCDREEVCSGNSPRCPDDQYETQGTVCRPENGVCDVAEYCTGISGGCPEDGFKSANTICRNAVPGFTCDSTDYCTGRDPTCAKDFTRPKGAECETITGKLSKCDGASKKCTTNQLVPYTLRDKIGEEDKDRAITFSCGTTCYLCGAPPSDADQIIRTSGEDQHMLKGASCSIGKCTEFVILPYPKCMSQCSFHTCPNSEKRIRLIYYLKELQSDGLSAEKYKCAKTVVASQNTECPPWDHTVPGDEAIVEAVAGGDPRYSLGDRMIQCDAPGEHLYVAGPAFKIYVTHTPVPGTPAGLAAYISKFRVTDLPTSMEYEGDDLIVDAAKEPAEWGILGTHGKPPSRLITVSPTNIFSTFLGMHLTFTITRGSDGMNMINLAYSGVIPHKGILAEGCPEEQRQEDQSNIPDHPRCDQFKSGSIYRNGCNYDMQATRGSDTIVDNSISLNTMAELVEYEPYEVVAVNLTQTQAPPTQAGEVKGGDDAGAAGEGASQEAPGASSSGGTSVLLIVLFAALGVIGLALIGVGVYFVKNKMAAAGQQKVEKGKDGGKKKKDDTTKGKKSDPKKLKDKQGGDAFDDTEGDTRFAVKQNWAPFMSAGSGGDLGASSFKYVNGAAAAAEGGEFSPNPLTSGGATVVDMSALSLAASARAASYNVEDFTPTKAPSSNKKVDGRGKAGGKAGFTIMDTSVRSNSSSLRQRKNKTSPEGSVEDGGPPGGGSGAPRTLAAVPSFQKAVAAHTNVVERTAPKKTLWNRPGGKKSTNFVKKGGEAESEAPGPSGGTSRLLAPSASGGGGQQKQGDSRNRRRGSHAAMATSKNIARVDTEDVIEM